jgi:hypothetical protein
LGDKKRKNGPCTHNSPFVQFAPDQHENAVTCKSILLGTAYPIEAGKMGKPTNEKGYKPLDIT